MARAHAVRVLAPNTPHVLRTGRPRSAARRATRGAPRPSAGRGCARARTRPGCSRSCVSSVSSVVARGDRRRKSMPGLEAARRDAALGEQQVAGGEVQRAPACGNPRRVVGGQRDADVGRGQLRRAARRRRARARSGRRRGRAWPASASTRGARVERPRNSARGGPAAEPHVARTGGRRPAAGASARRRSRPGRACAARGRSRRRGAEGRGRASPREPGQRVAVGRLERDHHVRARRAAIASRTARRLARAARTSTERGSQPAGVGGVQDAGTASRGRPGPANGRGPRSGTGATIARAVRVAFLTQDLQLSGGVGVIVAARRAARPPRVRGRPRAHARPAARPDWSHHGLAGARALVDAGRARAATTSRWRPGGRPPGHLFELDAGAPRLLRAVARGPLLPPRGDPCSGRPRPGARPAGALRHRGALDRPHARGAAPRRAGAATCATGSPRTCSRRSSAVPVAARGPLRILVEGSARVPFKGVPEALAATARDDARRATSRSCSPDGSGAGLPARTACVGPGHPAELARPLRARPTSLLKLSRVEGMFGPPLEAFHRGATCVVTPVSGHDEYIVHGENGLVVDWDDPAGTTRALDLLAADRALLHRLRCGALATARAVAVVGAAGAGDGGRAARAAPRAAAVGPDRARRRLVARPGRRALATASARRPSWPRPRARGRRAQALARPTAPRCAGAHDARERAALTGRRAPARRLRGAAPPRSCRTRAGRAAGRRSAAGRRARRGTPRPCAARARARARTPPGTRTAVRRTREQLRPASATSR